MKSLVLFLALFTFSHVVLAKNVQETKVDPTVATTVSAKEIDMSGLSQFKSTGSSTKTMTASCRSQFGGTFSSNEVGFQACMNEFEQSKFKPTSKNPPGMDNASSAGPGLQFSTELSR